jgi:2-keto-4-pentenoate hydratase/2-oxohepta-3-ene-1,7-dioic acid hydratase in catechol pathway
VIGTGQSIRIPPVSTAIDYEIEIAAVIGKRGRQIAVGDALEHVFGYVLFNDISARHLSVVGRRKQRPGDEFFDWLVGKWCDTFAVVGPYLVTVDDVPDVGSLEMALRVNGELQQHSSAGEMIFTVPEAIAWISGFLTLEPGDLICMGTPGGVGETTQTYLQSGDVVEATIEGLGTSINRVE